MFVHNKIKMVLFFDFVRNIINVSKSKHEAINFLIFIFCHADTVPEGFCLVKLDSGSTVEMLFPLDTYQFYFSLEERNLNHTGMKKYCYFKPEDLGARQVESKLMIPKHKVLQMEMQFP